MMTWFVVISCIPVSSKSDHQLAGQNMHEGRMSPLRSGHKARSLDPVKPNPPLQNKILNSPTAIHFMCLALQAECS